MNIKSYCLLLPCFLFSCLWAEPHYNYSHALVRDLSDEFVNSLKREEPEYPIHVELAKKQHEAYSELINHLVPYTIFLKADQTYPDCNFIEDTAILVGREAVISRMGAIERRGEEIVVREALETLDLDSIYQIQAPGTMDGGDILYTGSHLFVGISSRTNENALDQITQVFLNKLSVIPIPVADTLHLKSVVSFFDETTLVVADTPEGNAVMRAIASSAPNYHFVQVPDQVASNVLRIHDTLVIQAGFPESEKILRTMSEKAGVQVISLDMSELIKADGALTCGSLLF